MTFIVHFVAHSQMVIKETNIYYVSQLLFLRKQREWGATDSTWLPMTSTISAMGLLHFSLRIMNGETY